MHVIERELIFVSVINQKPFFAPGNIKVSIFSTMIGLMNLYGASLVYLLCMIWTLESSITGARI